MFQTLPTFSMSMHFFMEFVNKATGLRLYIPTKRKVKMNICSIWPFAQISDDFYYLDIWQCARYFVAALFKELALITIREMWGLESPFRISRSRSRLLWQSLSLVSKFETGLGLRGYSLVYITGSHTNSLTLIIWYIKSTRAGMKLASLDSMWSKYNKIYNFDWCEKLRWSKFRD